MKAFKRRSNGFSVIEIVVALAVTVMVVAVFTPAFFSSREDSRKYLCMQHLHQVSVQTQVFVQDRPKGNFPALNMSLEPNADGSISVAVARRGNYSGGWGYFPDTSWVCPSEAAPGIMQIRNNEEVAAANPTYRSMPVSFGYSIRMLYNGITWTDKNLGPPNEVAVFFDGYMNGPDSATGKNIEGNYLSSLDFAVSNLAYRHRGRYGQTAFADGHVKSFDFFDQSYFYTFGSGNQPASVVAAAVQPVAPVATTTTTGSTTTTTGSTTGTTSGSGGTGHNNNGHGNNIDGVDSSNPGKGKGGPGGGIDPSGTIDDEKKGKPV